MKKLEIGRKISYADLQGIDSTSKVMNMTRVKRTSKCMRILYEMIVHPRQLTSREIKINVYGRDIGKRCLGFFSALRHFGLANYVRVGHQCFWEPTVKGIRFYMSLH